MYKSSHRELTCCCVPFTPGLDGLDGAVCPGSDEHLPPSVWLVTFPDYTMLLLPLFIQGPVTHLLVQQPPLHAWNLFSLAMSHPVWIFSLTIFAGFLVTSVCMVLTLKPKAHLQSLFYCCLQGQG